jgi:ornithine cyclodeaminase/alanine dehydrogenase
MNTREHEGPVFVSSEATQAVFDWQQSIAAIQVAYGTPLDHSALPRRSVANGAGAWLRTLPAIPATGRYFGAKLMGMAPGASAPGVEYVIVLFDRETSRIAAFVDGVLVTGYRTAATSAAALDRLAASGPCSLGVLGSGLEAAMHVRAIASVRPLERVAVFSPTPERRAAFAAMLSDELGVATEAVGDAHAAVEGSDVVVAAARSHGERPILFGDWLAPGTTVVSIGSTIPQQREIDVSVVERCDLIVCDALDEVLDETGDMIAARDAGIAFRDKSISLTDLVTGAASDRVGAASMPMFKSVGGGLQDVVVAALVVDEARRRGLSTPLPIEFQTKH